MWQNDQKCNLYHCNTLGGHRSLCRRSFSTSHYHRCDDGESYVHVDICVMGVDDVEQWTHFCSLQMPKMHSGVSFYPSRCVVLSMGVVWMHFDTTADMWLCCFICCICRVSETRSNDDAGRLSMNGCRKWIPWHSFTLVANGMLHAWPESCAVPPSQNRTRISNLFSKMCMLGICVGSVFLHIL